VSAARTRQDPRSEFTRSQRAAKYILSKTRLRPKIAVVLGSGLGAFADDLTTSTRLPYDKISGFPKPTVEGHLGQFVIGKAGEIPVVAMQGRVHSYEGYSVKEVVYPMRVLRQMGIQAAILTNAAGAVNLSFQQGALVVIRDHLSLNGINPLIGPNEDRFGPRFPDMSQAYCPKYRQIAIEEGKKLGVDVREGVYAGLSGPSFETPAEIRYLRTMGADMVGMSTVPEVIVARHMSIRVLGISCVTNMAAGILDQPLSHAEVMETGERVKAQFVALLRSVIPRIAEDLEKSASGLEGT
jgi:purine-nucleoside phosphorylase